MRDRRDADVKALTARAAILHKMPSGNRGRSAQWICERRTVHHGYTDAAAKFQIESQRVELAFAEQVAAILEGLPDDDARTPELATFTRGALHELKNRRSEQAESAAAAAAAPSQEPAPTRCAEELYGIWFQRESGRDWRQGVAGGTAREPDATAEQEHWSEGQWAQWWIALGGFDDANGECAMGRSPLMWALKYGACWSRAHLVVKGLIPLTTPDRLRAKSAGRTLDYQVLHFAASGSDRALMRGDLVMELAKARADVDARTRKGYTPAHLAAGSGNLDALKALSDWGADLHAEDADGKNALDKAKHSSGSCAGRRKTKRGRPQTDGRGARLRAKPLRMDLRRLRVDSLIALGLRQGGRRRLSAQASFRISRGSAPGCGARASGRRAIAPGTVRAGIVALCSGQALCRRRGSRARAVGGRSAQGSGRQLPEPVSPGDGIALARRAIPPSRRKLGAIARRPRARALQPGADPREAGQDCCRIARGSHPSALHACRACGEEPSVRRRRRPGN